MTAASTKISLLLSAGVLALALTACDKATQTNAGARPASMDIYALPLTIGPAEASAPAPAADRLPAAPRPRLTQVRRPVDDYAYLDEAYWASDALDHAPPDYGFGYDGVDAWAWRAPDNGLELIEPLATGYRHYYYRPNAPYPYLVSDPDYAYGYEGQELAAIYGSAGQLLPWDAAGPAIDYAGRYLARALDLYRAAQEPDRRSVSAATWSARQPEVAAQSARWSDQRASQAQWRAYDEAHATQQAARWNNERQQRRDAADRFNEWRQSNFHGPAPAPVRSAPQANPQPTERQRRAEQDRSRQVQHQEAQLKAAQKAETQRQAQQEQGRQAGQPRPPQTKAQAQAEKAAQKAEAKKAKRQEQADKRKAKAEARAAKDKDRKD